MLGWLSNLLGGDSNTNQKSPTSSGTSSGSASGGFSGGGGASWSAGSPAPQLGPNGLIRGDTVVGGDSVEAVQDNQQNDPAAQAAAIEAAKKAAADAQTRREIGLNESLLGGAQTEFNTAKTTTQDRLQQLIDRYTGETTRNQGIFDEQSGVNQSNYNRNLQEALINAGRGRQGLLGTLSALGALGGSGIKLADRAVQQGASLDIADADSTFRDNQSSLSRAFDEYTEADKARVADARSQAAALEQQAQNNYLKTQQEIFVKMANLYNALGDSAQADNYIRQASSLSNQVGQSGVSPVGALSPITASFTPEALGSYVGGLNDVSVSQGAPSGSNLIPTLMASIRRREQGV